MCESMPSTRVPSVDSDPLKPTPNNLTASCPFLSAPLILCNYIHLQYVSGVCAVSGFHTPFDGYQPNRSSGRTCSFDRLAVDIHQIGRTGPILGPNKPAGTLPPLVPDSGQTVPPRHWPALRRATVRLPRFQHPQGAALLIAGARTVRVSGCTDTLLTMDGFLAACNATNNGKNAADTEPVACTLLHSLQSKEQRQHEHRAGRHLIQRTETDNGEADMNKAAESKTATGKASGNDTADSESERIAQVIHEAIDRFAEHAAEAEQRIKDAAAGAQVTIKTKQKSVRKTADNAERAVESYVEQHPWAALGAAFGVGVLISSLLRR